MCAHLPGAAEGSRTTGLRVLLAADLIFRAAELDHLQVLIAVTPGDDTEEEPNGLTDLAMEHANPSVKNFTTERVGTRPGHRRRVSPGPTSVCVRVELGEEVGEDEPGVDRMVDADRVTGGGQVVAAVGAELRGRAVGMPAAAGVEDHPDRRFDSRRPL